MSKPPLIDGRDKIITPLKRSEANEKLIPLLEKDVIFMEWIPEDLRHDVFYFVAENDLKVFGYKAAIYKAQFKEWYQKRFLLDRYFYKIVWQPEAQKTLMSYSEIKTRG